MVSKLVSVIIPNYCHSKFLDERIQCVLNQTYRNFEVIILDDCSPDNGASKSVIEKYRKNEHVSHIVYNEENSGSTFKQWDKGFSLAKGEYVWIAESDDKCEATLLERLILPLVNNNECVVAFCRSVAFNEDGIIGKVGPKNLCSGVIDGRKFIHDYMRSGNAIVNASSAIFKKCVLDKIPTDYKSFRGAGDRLFWIHIAEQGVVAFLDEKLNFFRRSKDTTTNRCDRDGSNQREDKVILDYIFLKGYISKQEYKQCRKKYVRAHIFEMIVDKQLKKDLYNVWNYSIWERFTLRLEAYWKTFMHKYINK